MIGMLVDLCGFKKSAGKISVDVSIQKHHIFFHKIFDILKYGTLYILEAVIPQQNIVSPTCARKIEWIIQKFLDNQSTISDRKSQNWLLTWIMLGLRKTYYIND